MVRRHRTLFLPGKSEATQGPQWSSASAPQRRCTGTGPSRHCRGIDSGHSHPRNADLRQISAWAGNRPFRRGPGRDAIDFDRSTAVLPCAAARGTMPRRKCWRNAAIAGRHPGDSQRPTFEPAPAMPLAASSGPASLIGRRVGPRRPDPRTRVRKRPAGLAFDRLDPRDTVRPRVAGKVRRRQVGLRRNWISAPASAHPQIAHCIQCGNNGGLEMVLSAVESHLFSLQENFLASAAELDTVSGVSTSDLRIRRRGFPV